MASTPFMYEGSPGTTNLIKSVWEDHYRQKGEDSPLDSLQRVVDSVYKDEKNFDSYLDAKKSLLKGFFNPGGRIHAGAGTDFLVTLINCFVSGTIEDSLDSIMDRLKDAALTQQQGGGIGMDFSTIRPKDAIVKKTNSVSSGVIPFMNLWHHMCSTIKSAGTRRGAMMAVLRIDHPDILAFIESKQKKGRLTNFNISVAVTDEFMIAIEKDLPWDLHFPVAHSKDILRTKYSSFYKAKTYIYKTLPARVIWDKLIVSTYNYAEPGVIFIDKINDLNNLFYCETIRATNPCVPVGTKVFTFSGVEKVESINPGRAILNNSGIFAKSQQIEIYENQELYEINFSDGGNLIATENHLFYTRNHLQQIHYDTTRLIDLTDEHLVRVMPGPKRYGTETSNTMNNLQTHGLNTYDYGFHYGAMLTRDIWNINEHQRLNKKIVNMISESLLNGEPKFYLSDRLYERAPQLFHRGVINGVITMCAITEHINTSDFQIVVKNINKELFQQLRLLLILNNIHPDYRELDNALIIKDSNIETLVKLSYVANRKIREASWYYVCNFRSHPAKWYARIKSIKKLKNTENIVFDIFEPHTDSWGTNGYSSKGCGEQPLPSYGQCDLGAINLARMVNNYFTKEAVIDWKILKETIHVGVRFLDNILDITNYPLIEQKEEALSKRRIGLGITGLGNFLEFLCIRYGSPESLSLLHEVMSFIRNETYMASSLLAKEKSPFPLYNFEKFSKSHMFNKLPNNIKEHIKKYGLRNGVLLTIAPTGSTSIYYGNISGGCEPVFSHRYYRKMLQSDNSEVVHGVFDYAFEKYIELFGEPENLKQLPNYMVTATELNVDEHLAVTAVLQEYIDAAISKTINCPIDISYFDFKKVYNSAYKLGLKGCTTYRPNLTRGWVLKETDPIIESITNNFDKNCCNNPSLVEIENCFICKNCGTSKCSI